MISEPELTAPLDSDQSLALTQPGVPDQNEEYLSFFDFSQAATRIKALIKQWQQELDSTLTRRKMRKIDVDLTQLQKEGLLKQDETFIPIRVIDSTIRREQPSFVSFLTQSRRLAIFECVDDPTVDTSMVESAFTKGMSYSGWQRPIYKCLDGAQTHGWDSVEIEYRDDRPLKCNIDHIGHENLVFARDSRDIEACEIVMRRYELTIAQVKRFVKNFGWDPIQAAFTYQKTDKAKDFQNIVVFKYCFKWQGIVYVGWYSDKDCSGWLKAPVPLSLGRMKTEEYTEVVPTPVGNSGLMLPMPQRKTRQVPDYETVYPFKILLYSETEEQALTEYKGRCFLDGPKQEAQTALWSILVNGSVRAGNVYGSPKNVSGTGAPVKKLDLNLEHGCLYSEPMDFWHTDYPDPNIIRASDSLETRTQVESGQIAGAVINREDSRKTAKEISHSEQEQAGLSSVGVTLFSIFLQSVWSHAWLVVQSQAIQGSIVFLQIDQTTNNPLGMPETMKVNNYAYIGHTYDIRSAGDIDVIQRQEKLQKRIALWPVISATPLAQTFLSDIIKESFPEDADRYASVLEQLAQQAQQGMAAGVQPMNQPKGQTQNNQQPQQQAA